MRLTFSLKIILTIGLIIPGLLGDAYLIEQTNTRSEQQQAAVEHTHRLIETAGSLMSVMKDAETGKRGFVITGEDSYLKPFLAAQQEITPVFDRLRALTAGNDHQQQYLTRIKQLIDEKFAELKQAIDARKRQCSVFLSYMPLHICAEHAFVCGRGLTWNQNEF